MADKNIFKGSMGIKLAIDQKPITKLDAIKGYYKWGKDNAFPSYILFLFNNHAEHGAIIKGKARYLAGTNILSTDESAMQWLKKANAKESWHDLSKKSFLDKPLYNGYYLKVITNALGNPIEWHHLESGKVRINEGCESFTISDNFKDQMVAKVILPKYKPGFVGTSIFEYKGYSPSLSHEMGIYPYPEYAQAIVDIDTDIRITTFFNSLVRNNFSAGNLITIYNGETDQRKKEIIVDGLVGTGDSKGEFAGEDNGGKTVVVFGNKDSKSTEVLPLNSNDLDKQYQEVRKANKEKIIGSHNVSGPLFKIKVDDKSIFTRSELREMHELFLNEYVKVEQKPYLDMLSKWYFLSTGKQAEFEIEQIKLIGVDLTDPNVAKYFTEDEIRESLGFEPRVGSVQPTGVPVEQAQVNEHIKNLTGKQMQGLMRIVTKYDKKLISKETALTMMKAGFGVSDSEALTFLNVADEETDIAVKQSIEDRNTKFFSLFEKYAHDVNLEDEVIDVRFDSSNPEDSVHNDIINALAENPYLTEDELAQALNTTKEVINSALSWLIAKKLIEAGEGSMMPTSKAISDSYTTEIYTEYTYQLTDEYKGKPLILTTSHPFCKRMVELYHNKAISFDKIDSLTNDFGENAFDFRGGFTTKKGGEVSNTCRHYWKAETKIRRVKK